MNEFQSTESGQGVLKEDYVSSPIGEALKRKRKKLKETKIPSEFNDETLVLEGKDGT